MLQLAKLSFKIDREIRMFQSKHKPRQLKTNNLVLQKVWERILYTHRPDRGGVGDTATKRRWASWGDLSIAFGIYRPLWIPKFRKLDCIISGSWGLCSCSPPPETKKIYYSQRSAGKAKFPEASWVRRAISDAENQQQERSGTDKLTKQKTN